MIYEALDHLQATPNAFPLTVHWVLTTLTSLRGPVVMNLLGSTEDTQIQSLLQEDSTCLRAQEPQLLSLGPRAWENENLPRRMRSTCRATTE